MAMLVAGCMAVLGACGSDDNGTADTDSGDVATQNADKQAEAEEAGVADAEEAGGPVDLPSGVKIGFVQATAASEGVQRVTTAAEEATSYLGWTMSSCDGQGVPAKISTCFERFISADVDIILSQGNDPALVGRQLKKADAAGIQIYSVGAPQPESPYVMGDYGPDDTEMTQLLNDFLFEEMERREGTELAIQSNKAIAALRVRREELQKGLDEQSEIEVAAENETDLTDPIASVTDATRTVLTANPDITAFWSSIDIEVPPLGRTVRSAAAGGDLPITVGFYAGKETLDLIRQGVVTAVVEAPVEASVWVALDQAAQNLARDAEPSKSTTAEGAYSLEFFAPVIVTGDENVPPEGQYVEPTADYVSYFEAKWHEEFGVGAGS